jgi:hypothetical protein
MFSIARMLSGPPGSSKEYDFSIMAAADKVTNEESDRLDLRTVMNATPGLIHTSRPDGYLDFFNQTWLSYVGKPLEHLRFFDVPRSLLGAHLRAFRR